MSMKIKGGKFMKKLVVSMMLTIFVFSICYPTIYATEQNIIEMEELVDTEENIVEEVKEKEEETTNIENIEIVEPKEEIILEEKMEEIQEELEETDKQELQSEEIEQSIEPKVEEKAVEPIVEAPSYEGRMYIDTPSNNQVCVLPDVEKLKIQGWAVSNDAQAALRLYVNGKYISNIHTRTDRGDVNQAVSGEYGGTANTPKAGFEIDLDIGTYSEGKYEIVVYQIGRNETIISKDTRIIQVKPKQYEGRMYIDTPSNNQVCVLPDVEKLKIQGWAVSNDAQAALRLYVNGKYISNIHTRTDRGDVNQAVSGEYGGTANTPKAGFEIDLDIGTYSEGKYEIVVYQIGRNETIISKDTRIIQVKPKQYAGRMYVDTGINATYHVPQNTKMNISGWAVSTDKMAKMLVKIDGKDCQYQVVRNSRGDVDYAVSPAYGGTTNTPNAGFSIDVNIDNLSDGRHTVIVQEVSRYGQILCETSITLNVITPSYDGTMYLESPINNKRYRSDSLDVSGWVLSYATDDYVCVYINDVFRGTAQRCERGDVLQEFNGKFGGSSTNPYPGFYCTIDTSNLGEGYYNLKVIHYSKYNKPLQTREVNFIISNTTTWGIDVSHHNDTINWDAVKNSGVNFAILKIAEYRESSGRTIVDSKFEENYAACKARGIAVGGYIYSYAFNSNEAAHEAEACLRVIAGKHFEMPIFFDIEDHIVTDAVNAGRTNKENLTNAAITFCDKMNASGYQAGVYSYRNFFYSYLDMPRLERYNIWLAHYVASTDYTGKYDIWQYTSSGRIPGISGNGGNVDLNWCFKRYY